MLDLMIEVIAKAEGAWKAGYLTWGEYERLVATLQLVNSYENKRRLENAETA